MKKSTLMTAVTIYQDMLLAWLQAKGIPHDVAYDALQTTVCKLLETKSYTDIPHNRIDMRIYAYLARAVNWEVLRGYARLKAERRRVGVVPDEDSSNQSVVYFEEEYPVTIYSSIPCPFCYTSMLNSHGACEVCHTILGAGTTQRETLRLEALTVEYTTNFALCTDVACALATLSALEQKVVTHVITGNDTLDDLAELSGASRAGLWRVWARAKGKLQRHLRAYA